MSVYSGDFLGFRLGNVHSSQLNITRVSNNDRYTENLTPTFKDQTAEIQGNDGVYYWGTYHTQQNFVIDFAFDDLRDEDIRRLRSVLNFKGVQELIFDEIPYKKYMVKCSNPPTLRYIAFNIDGVTVYKGEGTINLVAYYPYALSVNEIDISENNESTLELFNEGDLDTPFQVYFDIENDDFSINLIKDSITLKSLSLENIEKQNNQDVYICIDMKTNLIEGVNASFQKTGTLYNRFITGGDFFNLPVGTNVITMSAPAEKISYYNLYY